LNQGVLDCISVSNPRIKVLIPKLKVDGITKIVEQQEFTFDNTYSESKNSEEIFDTQIRDSVESLFYGDNITVFAYG
jgi:kinesin family protein 2/24